MLAACSPQASPTLFPSPSPPTATATSLPTAATPTVLPQQVISEIDQTLQRLAQQGLFSGSVLIARQGQILLSKGYGLADRAQELPNTPQTRFRIGSLTKQFTAMAILILESQGKLSVADPICNYLADCPESWKSITIHHLLTHTSGIPSFTELPGYSNTYGTPSPSPQTIARFRDLPLDFQPGKGWRYSNSGYILLGSIIEQVSGQSYEEFLQEYIFTPLELQDTGYDHNSSSLAIGYVDQYSSMPANYIDMSIPYAAGALYSTVEDLYTWEQSLSTEQLVPQKYLDEMFAPQAAIEGSEGMSYGYGWSIRLDAGQPYMGHTGSIQGFSSIITRHPEEQLTIILLSNQENSNVGFLREVIFKKLLGSP